MILDTKSKKKNIELTLDRHNRKASYLQNQSWWSTPNPISIKTLLQFKKKKYRKTDKVIYNAKIRSYM